LHEPCGSRIPGDSSGRVRRRPSRRRAYNRRMLDTRRLVAAALLWLGAALAGAQVVDEEPAYFEEPPPAWQADWGTDAAFTLSDIEQGSASEHNDRTTNFDPLWLRLFGFLRYGDKAELVIDLFSSNAAEPKVFGLYARIEHRPWLALRAGLIPMVVGGWQERAYPHLQPLIDEPLSSGYLLPIRSGAIPGDVDELLSQRGARNRTRYPMGVSQGSAVTLIYEHCWDTGIELFGQLGPIRYRGAVMHDVPGAAAPAGAEERSGNSFQGRLTWQASQALRLGGSFATGPYLKKTVEPFLPEGRVAREYDQRLWGADLRFEKGRVDVHAEWLHNEWESPWIGERLLTDSWEGELSLELVPGLRAAARASGLVHSDVTASSGRRLSWEANARRYEAGLAWRFFERKVALKTVFRRTEIDLEPREVDDVWAAQLVFSR